MPNKKLQSRRHTAPLICRGEKALIDGCYLGGCDQAW